MIASKVINTWQSRQTHGKLGFGILHTTLLVDLGWSMVPQLKTLLAALEEKGCLGDITNRIFIITQIFKGKLFSAAGALVVITV